jgi:hypothetical protein
MEIFKDLLAMLEGIAGGALTLVWAVALFIMMVYILALVCRILFGSVNDDVTDVYPYFNSVGESMFTVFRCSFGDCSTEGGAPLAVFITSHYGFMTAIAYCGFVFFIVIGLFNVISAIFVDSTMSHSAELESKKLQLRLADEDLWAANVTKIIRKFLRADPETKGLADAGMTDGEVLSQLLDLEFSTSTIDDVLRDADRAVGICLDHLDIDRADHMKLSDILDPDNNGGIGVLELIDGLKRLRGEPRRSDIVTVDLMIRSMQEQIADMDHRLKSLHDGVIELLTR